MNVNIQRNLFLLAGIVFIGASILGSSSAFLPIGICFIIIGISKIKKNK